MYLAMYEFGVDVVLQGHDHVYERIAPLNPAGDVDATYGIRAFTVGTGGAALFGSSGNALAAPRSEMKGLAYGVVKFTLHPTTYDWVFLPIAGSTFSDSGSASVHPAPATVPSAPTIDTAIAGDASATVTWTAPASDGGSPITGYVVTPFIGAIAQPATNVGVVLTADITGLSNGTAYTFRVAAINAIGTGGQSANSAAVTPVGGVLEVSIVSPTVGQVLASSPVTISGTATDDVGVTSLEVWIYRSVNGGQFWNGTSWQSAYPSVNATLASPGATSTSWTYTFNAPPGGTFAVSAVVYDASANYAATPFQYFTITDSIVPAVTVTSPTPSQALTGRPVVITGTATDSAGISEVRVAVYRAVEPVGQFWNGTTWQVAYTTVDATLTSPGATSTGWTYSFDPPQSGGWYYVAGLALDTSYNYSFSAFVPFSLPDNIAPNATIISPAEDAVTTGNVTITADATDNSAIYSLPVAIYRVSTNEFWNGTTWQAGWATVAASTATPGAATATYTYSFLPPAPGQYLVGVLPIDTNYNYTWSGWRSITAT